VLFQTNYTIYTLPIFDRVRLRVRVRFNVQIKYSNSMFFKNSLSASWPVRELSSPRPDWPRVGLSASCPVSANTTCLQNKMTHPHIGIQGCQQPKQYNSHFIGKLTNFPHRNHFTNKYSKCNVRKKTTNKSHLFKNKNICTKSITKHRVVIENNNKYYSSSCNFLWKQDIGVFPSTVAYSAIFQ